MKTICLFFVALSGVFGQTSPNELNERGLQATDRREYDEAERLFTEAIQQWHAQGKAYDLHAAIVQTNLAQTYAVRGDRKRCAATIEEALGVYRRTLGLKDLRTLSVLNLLGGVYMMLGNHPRATELFEEALPVEREVFPNNVELARTISGLASLAMQENRALTGAPLAEEALALMVKIAGDDSVDTALAYANMAEAHRVLGRPDRAAPLFRKARTIYEKQLGPEHPRVSSILTQEGLMALHEGKLGTAEETLTRAMALVEKSCPKCAYERIAAANDLALVRIQQGKFEEADRLLTDVLSMQERVDGLPPAELAVTLNSLAVVRQKERRYEDAERLKRRAALLTMSYR
jgi:tetratricopeptide (TPR) repeat protein